MLRPGQVQHRAQVFAAAVARDVDERPLWVEDIGAKDEQAVDDPEDRSNVSPTTRSEGVMPGDST